MEENREVEEVQPSDQLPENKCEKNMMNILDFDIRNFKIKIKEKAVPVVLDGFIKYIRSNQYYAIIGLTILNTANPNKTSNKGILTLNAFFVYVNLLELHIKVSLLKSENKITDKNFQLATENEITIIKNTIDQLITYLKDKYQIHVTKLDLNKKLPTEKDDIDSYIKIYNQLHDLSKTIKIDKTDKIVTEAPTEAPTEATTEATTDATLPPPATDATDTDQIAGRRRPTNLQNLTKQRKYRRTRSKSCKRKNKKSII